MVRSPTSFGLSRNGCWTYRRSQLPWAPHLFFCYATPLNDSVGQHTTSLKSVACFLFFFSPAILCLLILLLLLMSGNLHSNPGPIFPCSVCAGNVTWRGKSVHCCICSKWVHLRCSQLSLSKFRALDSSHSWSCLPCRNTVTLSSDSSDMYTSTVQSGPSSANAALLPHPCLQTSYSPSAHFISSPFAPSPLSLAPGCPSASSPSPTLSGFFNGMLEVFKPGALNYFTFFRPILSTLSASRNPILTHLPLSRFLDSDRTHSRSGILSPNATHASGGIVIFVRQGLSFSKVSTSSLSLLDPYYDYVGINISLNSSSSLSFLNVYAPPIASLQWMAEPTLFLPLIFPPPEISSFKGDFNCHFPLGLKEVLLTSVGGKYSTGSSQITSFPSMTLTHPYFSIAFLAVAPLFLCSLFSCPFLLLVDASGPGF